jgi:hypothetical protein
MERGYFAAMPKSKGSLERGRRTRKRGLGFHTYRFKIKSESVTDFIGSMHRTVICSVPAHGQYLGAVASSSEGS